MRFDATFVARFRAAEDLDTRTWLIEQVLLRAALDLYAGKAEAGPEVVAEAGPKIVAEAGPKVVAEAGAEVMAWVLHSVRCEPGVPTASWLAKVLDALDALDALDKSGPDHGGDDVV